MSLSGLVPGSKPLVDINIVIHGALESVCPFLNAGTDHSIVVEVYFCLGCNLRG